MQSKVNSSKTENESSNSAKNNTVPSCNTCGGEFETPLLAITSSGFPAKEYYACPNCLSKLKSYECQNNQETKEVTKLQQMEANKKEKPLGCEHHLGYLTQRPKNTTIPEDCFTCTKMIDCMSQ
jgi:hypothetical protein